MAAICDRDYLEVCINDDYVTSIYNEGGCISLIFLDIDIQPGNVAAICDRDYLEVDIEQIEGF